MSRNMGIHERKRQERELHWRIVKAYMGERKVCIESIHKHMIGLGFDIERHTLRNMMSLKRDEGKIRCGKDYLWELGEFEVSVRAREEPAKEFKVADGMSDALARMFGFVPRKMV